MVLLGTWFLLLCMTCCQAGPGWRSERSEGPRERLASKAAEVEQLHLPGQCSVNGLSLVEGSRWFRSCSECICQGGQVSCQRLPCEEPRTKTTGEQSGKDGVLMHQRAPARKPGGGRTDGKHLLTPTSSGKSTTNAPHTSGAPATRPPPRAGSGPPPREAFRWEEPWALGVSASSSFASSPSLRDRLSSSDEDHDDDDDDDDSRARLMLPPIRPPIRPPVRPPFRPPVRPPVRPSVRPPPGRAGGPGRGGTWYPSRPMESLPAGCLLAESLIACGSTGLTHMPFIRDSALRTLYLPDNRIRKLPPKVLAGLPNLEWLDLSKNQLDDSSLTPLLFQNLTKLRRLILDGNNLTKIPANLPSSLLELKINDNRLSGLTPSSFNGLSKLLTLELEDNRFHDGNVSPLTFRPLRRLLYLRLEDNKFRAIPSGLPPSLQELHLSDNKIEVVHAGILNKTADLRVLDLSHNRIREDRIAPQAWIHLQKLELLDLSHNRLAQVPSFLPVGLRQLLLQCNQIQHVPAYVFAHLRPGLDALSLSHNRLQDAGLDQASLLGLGSSLAELLLDHNALSTIPAGLPRLKNLQILRLDHNAIRHVPMDALCDTRAPGDSPLVSVHLQHNLIQPRQVPPLALSCIRNYSSILLRPQSHDPLQ